MNWKLALTALLASPGGTGLFASAQECPPKPIPLRDIKFHDIGGEGVHGYELHGNARIVEPAPDGIPRALRIDQVYSYALLKGVDISPASMPEVTLSVSAYIESIRPCTGCNVPEQNESYGWVISHDNNGWDRAIFLHDERFNGMGMTSGRKPNSKFQLTPTLQKWIHILGVWRQGGECALYIENERVPFTQKVIGRNNAGLPDVAIGAPQWEEFGKGNDNDFWIKDVKIFDYALSDDEIQSLNCHFEETLEPTIDCGQGDSPVFSCSECVAGDGSASGCAGDCMWRPEIPHCVEKGDSTDNIVDEVVSCGDHDAADCSQCDVSDGSSGCSGDCKFTDGQCRPSDWEPPVDCGTHDAASCGECPYGEGASGCAGDCMWNPVLGECTEDDGSGSVSCGTHDAADCSQCDVSDGSSGCTGDCKFADGQCRPSGWEPPVDCGTHDAASCGECPYGEGASGCAGDCMWNPVLGECTEDDGSGTVSCGTHNAADCSQCDVSADGSSGCTGDCKFAEGQCRPFDWEPVCIPINVALAKNGGVALQSSTDNPAWLAIDGKTGQDYFKDKTMAKTVQERSKLPFWMVMFSRTTVSHVKIFNRMDCCTERQIGLVVEIFDGGKKVYGSQWSAKQETQTAKPVYNFSIPQGVVGDKVKVRLTKNYKDALALAEVQVTGCKQSVNTIRNCKLSNVALASHGGVATQSSTHNHANLAIDGNTKGHYVNDRTMSHTVEGRPNAWWQVKFKRAIISDIAVHNRSDCCADRLVGSVVEIFDAGKMVYSSKFSNAAESSIARPVFRYVIPDIVGDLVKVRRDPAKTVPLHLAEVEVFGKTCG